MGCRDEADLYRAAVSIHLRTDFGHFGIKCLTRECITADLCQLTNIDFAKVDFIEVDTDLRALRPDKPDDRLIWPRNPTRFGHNLGDCAIKWCLYTGIGNPAARDAKRTLRIHKACFRHRNRLFSLADTVLRQNARTLRFGDFALCDKDILFTWLAEQRLQLGFSTYSGSSERRFGRAQIRFRLCDLLLARSDRQLL